LIICTYETPEIDRTYDVQGYDGQNKLQIGVLKVVRKATREEYVEWCNETNSKEPMTHNDELFYYEVLTD